MDRDIDKPSMPLVSVVLPVYNGELFLAEAIDSILAQTYGNLELIIVNDGSTDSTSYIVRSYNDPRIRYYEQTNQGIAKSLNFGIRLACGEYVARQDADDVSMPCRIEKQVAFMVSHPNYGMVGTWAEIWKEDKKTNRSLTHPSTDEVLKFELLFDSYFVHSSVLIRKAVFQEVGYYTPEISRQPEDYELWSRVARVYKVANIPEVLHSYREVDGSLCRTGINPFLDRVINICSENLAYSSDYKFPDKLYKNVAALAHGASWKVEGFPNFRLIYEMLERIVGNFGKSRELEYLAQKRLLEIANSFFVHKYGKTGHLINRIYSVYLRYGYFKLAKGCR